MRRASRAVLVLASLVVVIAGLKLGRDLLVPILLGATVAGASSPIVNFLLKRRLPPILVAGLIVLLDVLVLAGLGAALLYAASEVQTVLPKYETAFVRADARLAHELAHRGLEVHRPLFRAVGGAGSMTELGAVANQFAGGATLLTVVLLVTFFTLCEVTTLGDKLREITKDAADEHFARIDHIVADVQRYVLVKIGTSALAAACVLVVLLVCRVDLALLLALTLLVLHFIPNVGAVLAMIPAILVALLSRGPGTAAIVAVSYLLVNFVVGSILEPRWLGRTLGLSPLAVLLSLLFWGWVWGPFGAALSVPLLGIFKIVCENTRGLKSIATMLEDAPDHAEPKSGTTKRVTSSLIRRPTFVLGTKRR